MGYLLLTITFLFLKTNSATGCADELLAADNHISFFKKKFSNGVRRWVTCC
jgi:hypothetical protein